MCRHLSRRPLWHPSTAGGSVPLHNNDKECGGKITVNIMVKRKPVRPTCATARKQKARLDPADESVPEGFAVNSKRICGKYKQREEDSLWNLDGKGQCAECARRRVHCDVAVLWKGQGNPTAKCVMTKGKTRASVNRLYKTTISVMGLLSILFPCMEDHSRYTPSNCSWGSLQIYLGASST